MICEKSVEIIWKVASIPYFASVEGSFAYTVLLNTYISDAIDHKHCYVDNDQEPVKVFQI